MEESAPPTSGGAAARGWWQGPGGVGEVLAMAYPLVLGHMSFTVQTFVDRVFLTWYSTEAVAGAVSALFSTWALIGVFLGTGEYVTAFVAQYLGGRRPDRIGPVMWQGFYFALGAGVFVAALSPLARPYFTAGAHAPLVLSYEIEYATILMWGAFPIILMATLSTFFAGRGETHVVLKVNLLSTAVNVVLDYLWIFGHAGFPRAGVAGAAWATVTSQAAGAACFLVLIARPRFRDEYAILSGWRLEPALLGRLLRFGLPTGLQYSLEIAAFALFMVIVGRIGTAPLAASGIAFSLNMLVFMPMLGLGLGVCSLVGRHLGADRPDVAERTTWSAFRVSMVYMTLCGVLYVALPRLLLAPYTAGADPVSFAGVENMAVVLLRFVAAYSVFDMMSVVFAFALRGAGDTRYPLATTVTFAAFAMLLPAYLLCVVGDAGVYTAWTCASAYVFLQGLAMLRRFRGGHWRTLRIIEPRVVDPA